MPDVTLKRRSPWVDVWKRLKKNRLATVCLFVFLFCVVAIVFAPFIAPYD